MADGKVDFERAFAGALFQDPGLVVCEAVKGGVTADWFTQGKWRLAWSAAVSLWRGLKQGAEVDACLIVAEAKRLAAVNPKGFDGAALTAGDAADAIDVCPAAACVGGYIAQLKGAMILRSMRKAVEQTFKVAGKMEPELACEDLVARLFEILSRTVAAKTERFADLVDRSVGKMREAHRIRYEEGRNDYVPGLATPWWSLTELLNGLMPGFHVLGARTSVGKTSFALQLVRFFAERGCRVGFDSLDMNTRSFVDRFIAESARVSLYKVNFGWADDGDMARIEAAAAKVRAWPVDPIVEYDVDRLMNWCRVRKSAKALARGARLQVPALGRPPRALAAPAASAVRRRAGRPRVRKLPVEAVREDRPDEHGRGEVRARRRDGEGFDGGAWTVSQGLTLRGTVPHGAHT